MGLEKASGRAAYRSCSFALSGTAMQEEVADKLELVAMLQGDVEELQDEKQHMQRALNGVFSMCVCACARVFVHVCTCVHISLSLSICVCFCGDRRTG